VKYIFDTNVCIQILKGNSVKIKDKLAVVSNDNIIIPAVVRFELFYGAYKSNNPDKTLKILHEFLNAFDSLSFNDSIAEKCGEIRGSLEKSGTPIGPYDLIIAATAVSENLILITNNLKEFSRVKDLQFEDWQ
jgi:tRNA(fMet)-specific endonuclease VapC